MKQFLCLTAFAALASLTAVSAQAAPCAEGQVQVVSEYIPASAERPTRVTYVCQGGEFVRKFPRQTVAAQGANTCSEGHVQIISEYIPASAERPTRVPYVCQDGRYVRQFGRQAANSNHGIRTTCINGEFTQIYEQNPNNDSYIRVSYVCQGGRLVKAN